LQKRTESGRGAGPVRRDRSEPRLDEEPGQLAPFFNGKPAGSRQPQSPQCSDCNTSMTIKLVTPVLFASDVDDVIYVCERCGAEARRSVKRT